ncbi:hypothetical protein P3C22_26145, partial [Pseudomonas sp. ER28]|uniref:hypothetical protein n=1 Tax=Pseudomonas sp. ER28 TaxID=3033801 RepID=UPI0023DFF0EA
LRLFVRSGLLTSKPAPHRPSTSFDIEARAAQAFDVELHHALGNELDHLLEQISVCPFLNQLGQCDSGLGHRGFSGECLVFANSTLAKNHDDHPLSPAGRLRLVQLHHFPGHDLQYVETMLEVNCSHDLSEVEGFLGRLTHKSSLEARVDRIG